MTINVLKVISLDLLILRLGMKKISLYYFIMFIIDLGGSDFVFEYL